MFANESGFVSSTFNTLSYYRDEQILSYLKNYLNYISFVDYTTNIKKHRSNIKFTECYRYIHPPAGSIFYLVCSPEDNPKGHMAYHGTNILAAVKILP